VISLRAKSVGLAVAFVISISLAGILVARPALAQNPNATITGQVLDAGGAAIAGAQVTVTNTSTNIARSIKSDTAGRYLVSNLNPGTYIAAQRGLSDFNVA
jgi:uncharacterized surface anchored protein